MKVGALKLNYENNILNFPEKNQLVSKKRNKNDLVENKKVAKALRKYQCMQNVNSQQAILN